MDKDLIKTVIPLALGIVAGAVSFSFTGNIRARDPFGIIILAFFIYLHKFILPRFQIQIETKDWLGIGFLTLSSWYISWTLLLNQ